MRVLVVTHSNDLSGANKSLMGIIDTLKNKVDFNVVVNSDGLLSKELEKRHVKVYHLNYDWMVGNKYENRVKDKIHLIQSFEKYWRKRFYKVPSFIKGQNYDLVYTNTSTIDYGAIIAKKFNLPHVWHIREYGKKDFEFRSLVPLSYYKKQLKSASKLIMVSKSLENEYKKKYRLNNTHTIYNGIKYNKKNVIEDFNFSKNTPINISIVGQVRRSKGQDQAIKACKVLRKQGYKIILNIVGKVDKSYIKSEIPEIENLKWVKFWGQVSDVRKIRNLNDIELVCSKSEAFGRVTLEAMLNGLIVIGANTGGTKELIKNTKTGYLYKYNNIDDLSEKIKLVINSSEKENIDIVQNAQKFAEEFSVENNAEKVYKLFKKIAKK